MSDKETIKLLEEEINLLNDDLKDTIQAKHELAVENEELKTVIKVLKAAIKLF